MKALPLLPGRRGKVFLTHASHSASFFKDKDKDTPVLNFILFNIA